MGALLLLVLLTGMACVLGVLIHINRCVGLGLAALVFLLQPIPVLLLALGYAAYRLFHHFRSRRSRHGIPRLPHPGP